MVKVKLSVGLCWAGQRRRASKSPAHAYTRADLAREGRVTAQTVGDHVASGLLREHSLYGSVSWIARRQRQALLRMVKLKPGKIADEAFVGALALVRVVLPAADTAMAADLPMWVGVPLLKVWRSGKQLPGTPMRARVFRLIAKLVRADRTHDIVLDALDRMEGFEGEGEGSRDLIDRIVRALDAGPASLRAIAESVDANPKVVSNALNTMRSDGLVMPTRIEAVRAWMLATAPAPVEFEPADDAQLELPFVDAAAAAV